MNEELAIARRAHSFGAEADYHPPHAHLDIVRTTSAAGPRQLTYAHVMWP